MHLYYTRVFPERIKSTAMRKDLRAGSSGWLERSSNPKGYDDTDNRKVGSSNLPRPTFDFTER